MRSFKRFRFKYPSTPGSLKGAAAAVASAWLVMMGGAGAAPRADLSTASPPVQGAACPAQPAAPVAGKKDGQFVLQADLSSMASSDIASFMGSSQNSEFKALQGRFPKSSSTFPDDLHASVAIFREPVDRSVTSFGRQ